MLFGDETQKIPKKLISNDWKEVGFSAKDPRTDFRSSGILGLHCLRYFVKNYTETFIEMIQYGSEYFYVAICSLNITVPFIY